ncbi:Fic family protein [Salinibaculum rarum]|uniref:Fic family protein n=1 Tax=Salinibaculum rarum TaxID=3058903 RepID=UPI0034E95036
MVSGLRIRVVLVWSLLGWEKMVATREYIVESNAIEDVYDDSAVEDSVEAWEYLQEQDELGEEDVKEAHRLLLRNRQPDVAGEYRDVHVRIGGDVPPHPSVVSELMGELVARVPSTGVEAIQWHVDFEGVHPFVDGNGRVGRLVYLWHCREVLGVEPVVWREADVEGYYALFQTESFQHRD